MKHLKNNKGSTLVLVLMLTSVLSVCVGAFQYSSAIYTNKSNADYMDKQAYLSARGVADALFYEIATGSNTVSDLLDLMTQPEFDSSYTDLTLTDSSTNEERYEAQLNASRWSDVKNLGIVTLDFDTSSTVDNINFGEVKCWVEQISWEEYIIHAEATVGSQTASFKAEINASHDVTIPETPTLTPTPDNDNDNEDGGDLNVFYLDYAFGIFDYNSSSTNTQVTGINFSAIEDTLVIDSPFMFTGATTFSAPLYCNYDMFLFDVDDGTVHTTHLYFEESVESKKSIVFDSSNITYSPKYIRAGENIVFGGTNITVGSQVQCEKLYISQGANVIGYEYVAGSVSTGAWKVKELIVSGELTVDGDIEADKVTVTSTGKIIFGSGHIKTSEVEIQSGGKIVSLETASADTGSSDDNNGNNGNNGNTDENTDDNTDDNTDENDNNTNGNVDDNTGENDNDSSENTDENNSDANDDIDDNTSEDSSIVSRIMTYSSLYSQVEVDVDYNNPLNGYITIVSSSFVSVPTPNIPSRTTPSWARIPSDDQITEITSSTNSMTRGNYYRLSSDLDVNFNSIDFVGDASKPVYVIVSANVELERTDSNGKEVYFILESGAQLIQPRVELIRVYADQDTRARDEIESLIAQYWGTFNENTGKFTSTAYPSYQSLKDKSHDIIEGYNMASITSVANIYSNGGVDEKRLHGTLSVPVIYSALTNGSSYIADDYLVLQINPYTEEELEQEDTTGGGTTTPDTSTPDTSIPPTTTTSPVTSSFTIKKYSN